MARKKSKNRRKNRDPGDRAASPSGLRHLAMLDPERCLPPVYTDGQHVVPEPHGVLGLEPGASHEAIRAAYREGLTATPPESHPEEARRLREARDRLIAPDRLFERLLGELRVPDPAKYGLPAVAATTPRLDAEARLLGQCILYALLEDALVEPSEPPETEGDPQLPLF